MSEAPALVLDAGAPPKPPTWLRAHAPQLCALAAVAGLNVLPRPANAVCLLPLGLAAAAVQPGAGSLLRKASPMVSALVTAYVFGQLQASLLPPAVAVLGVVASGVAALMQARVLLLSVFVMLMQLLLARAVAAEARLRGAAAK